MTSWDVSSLILTETAGHMRPCVEQLVSDTLTWLSFLCGTNKMLGRTDGWIQKWQKAQWKFVRPSLTMIIFSWNNFVWKCFFHRRRKYHMGAEQHKGDWMMTESSCMLWAISFYVLALKPSTLEQYGKRDGDNKWWPSVLIFKHVSIKNLHRGDLSTNLSPHPTGPVLHFNPVYLMEKQRSLSKTTIIDQIYCKLNTYHYFSLFCGLKKHQQWDVWHSKTSFLSYLERTWNVCSSSFAITSIWTHSKNPL